MDGRIRIGLPADQSGDVTLHAIEANWPDAIAGDINSNFLEATGRVTTLAIELNSPISPFPFLPSHFFAQYTRIFLIGY